MVQAKIDTFELNYHLQSLTFIPGPALSQCGVRYTTDAITEGSEGVLNVLDWFVKAPATQKNGMMCSFSGM